MARTAVDLIVKRRRSGDKIGATISRVIDPDDRRELDSILLDAVLEDGWDRERVGEFEMEVRPDGGRTFTHPAT